MMYAQWTKSRGYRKNTRFKGFLNVANMSQVQTLSGSGNQVQSYFPLLKLRSIQSCMRASIAKMMRGVDMYFKSLEIQLS